MQTENIRQQLHQRIDESDEKLLKLLYVLAMEYNNDFSHEFAAHDIKQFDERSAKRLRGESKTYTWQEAKEMASGKKAE